MGDNGRPNDNMLKHIIYGSSIRTGPLGILGGDPQPQAQSVERRQRLQHPELARELKREWYWRDLEHAWASNRERSPAMASGATGRP